MPKQSSSQLVRLDAGFVEAVLSVQNLVSAGAPAEDVYQVVVDNAVQLLRGDSGSLRFRDLEDPDWMVAAAAYRVAGKGERWRQRSPISEGVSGRVISTGKLVVAGSEALASSRLAPRGSQAAVGVPVSERGRVIGSLVVASSAEGRQFAEDEQQVLSDYAQHVSLVLSVVRAGHAVQQAFTDSLTGLGNRALLLDRLEHELVQADRGGEPVTVLFIDLDRFKLVNDSLGHLAGDQLLKHVAERLRDCIRDGDVCARLGGDEFAIVLPGANAESAERLALELEELIAAATLAVDDETIAAAASVGVAATGGGAGIDVAQLLTRADADMYRRKALRDSLELADGARRSALPA
jgi:diguanylate cyclase (GGDEF)-like protein